MFGIWKKKEPRPVVQLTEGERAIIEDRGVLRDRYLLLHNRNQRGHETLEESMTSAVEEQIAYEKFEAADDAYKAMLESVKQRARELLLSAKSNTP